jgi:Xaa-Pro aminopeptidase
MACEAARLSPSLAAAFLGLRAPPAPPFLRRLPLLLPRRFLRASASSSSSGGDGRAVALPSSELRKRRTSSSATSAPAEDDKLRSLRRLFARPDIAIDAYIVPSQDAHQVHHLPRCCKFVI